MILLDTLKRLTYNYVKTPISNTYKLIKLFSDELEEVKEALEVTNLWRDIEIAEGETLDLIGQNVNELRLGRVDSVYRQALLIAIARNVSGGDVERLNEILSILLQDKYLGIVETWSNVAKVYDWQDLDDEWENIIGRWNVQLDLEQGEPAAIIIRRIEQQDSPNTEFLKRVVSAGIRIIEVAEAEQQFTFKAGQGVKCGQFSQGGTKL